MLGGRARVGRQFSSRHETSISSAFVESARNRARLASGCNASGYKYLGAIYMVQDGGEGRCEGERERQERLTVCMPS
jgi:biotin-(acetyl-CoA carboxylase) ligase